MKSETSLTSLQNCHGIQALAASTHKIWKKMKAQINFIECLSPIALGLAKTHRVLASASAIGLETRVF